MQNPEGARLDPQLGEYRLDMVQRNDQFRGLMNNTEATIFAPHVDITKSQTAYGRLAIVKLRKEIVHKDLTISRQALVTLLDFVHDPEKAVEVIRLNVLARLVRLMVSEDDFTRQHTLCVLRVLSTQPNGPQAIADKKYIIQNLIKTLHDPVPEVRLQAALTTEMLSKSWFAYDCLVCNSFVHHIVSRLKLEEDISVLKVILSALESLMDKSDIAKEQGVREGGCELVVQYLKHPDTDVRAITLDVLVQIFTTHNGKLAGENCPTDIIAHLIESLDDDDEEVLQGAAVALGFLFVTTPCKLRGVELKAVEKLLPLALTANNNLVKQNVIQALTNFAAAPAIKLYLLNFVPEMKCINTSGSADLHEAVVRLITVVQYKV